MGFWGWITGGGKAVENATEMGKTITDGLVNGIDAIVYTDEEKAQARQKASETLLKYWEAIGQENTEQSKARRELARMTFQVFFSLLLVGVVARFWGKVEAAKFVFDVVGKITWLVTMIAGIYFGPHQISKIWSKNGNNGNNN